MLSKKQFKALKSLISQLKKSHSKLRSVEPYSEKIDKIGKLEFYKEMYNDRYDRLSEISQILKNISPLVIDYPVTSSIKKLLSEMDKRKPRRIYTKHSEYSSEIDLYYNSSHLLQIQISETNGFLPGIIFELQDICKLQEREVGPCEELLKKMELLSIENDELKQSIQQLQKENKQLKTEQQPLKNEDKVCFTKNKDHARGGCSLTDNQIERLLRIFARRGKYAEMSLNQAIASISQTHGTYYKVVKRDYLSAKTRERIKRIAEENDIILPPVGSIKL